MISRNIYNYFINDDAESLEFSGEPQLIEPLTTVILPLLKDTDLRYKKNKNHRTLLH